MKIYLVVFNKQRCLKMTATNLGVGVGVGVGGGVVGWGVAVITYVVMFERFSLQP